MKTNIVKPLANAICISCYEPSECNHLTTINTSILYGTIIINDCECMYIKILDTDRTKDVLFDVSMPMAAYAKCRYEIQTELELILKEM